MDTHLYAMRGLDGTVLPENTLCGSKVPKSKLRNRLKLITCLKCLYNHKVIHGEDDGD